MESERTLFPIDIISDVVCPWCYLGKKRLEQALAERSDRFVFEIRWRPYLLNPEIPLVGVPYQEFLQKKFGSLDRMLAVWKRLEDLGRDVGIHFQFGKIPTAPNTIPIHALLSQIQDRLEQNRAMGLLFQAHFEAGKDMSSSEVLWELLSPFFPSKEVFFEIWLNSQYPMEIRNEVSYYQSNGVQGVPYFILGEKYALSGAQEKQVFLDIMDQISVEKK